MTSALKEPLLSYALLSEGGQCGCPSAVHESSPPRPPYHAWSIATARPSAGPTPPRRAPGFSTPRVWLHLWPGQKGTKQLLAQYGDRLICVRYRYDAQRKKRFKTVELVVAERDSARPRPRGAHDQIVSALVALTDVALCERVKQAGQTWNPERRVWRLRYDRVVALGLNSRIIDDLASRSGYP